ncbi:RNA-binding domain-containing protein [Leptolinea tardivitalis]|uniref:RNA-binding domain-containing protein n=1 Tax=Leptolinea tardivitalis TaxID=229920 RepID=UPI000AA90298|nr:RNA-binding domain-containing protein [Leptolinea tardivitalis]GAP21152.1 predicted metal-dependent phosphoesterase [Leptolinea tardivitalis]
MNKQKSAGKKVEPSNQWRTMDLHIHTPASSDFQQPEISYLELIQRAEQRNLDIIAFTDHNTIAGYRSMQNEIEQLELLEKLNRLLPDEKNRLLEYRRLLKKILVLPGIEFTATFGFHIIGVFSQNTPVRDIEHLLLDLKIPGTILDDGSATVGATVDVLTAYQKIQSAGGIVIAAHANSSNGVAMRGFNFGGQTKIAYTQDEALDALEVTDLDTKAPRSTAAFFNGTKPEYPRRMHCIQGSDAHRLTADPLRKKNLGIGDRATDVLIPEVSFKALKDLFGSNDFSRTRPHRLKEEPAFDFIHASQEEGANIIQDFHESMTVRGGKLYNIIADICAFANTNGGTLYIGTGADPHKPPIGISDPEQNINLLEKEISKRISPALTCHLDVQETRGKKIIRVIIPRGDDAPYAVEDNKIYVRSEAETGLAVRDEIVGLVTRGKARQVVIHLEPGSDAVPEITSIEEKEFPRPDETTPRTGVEVASVEERQGTRYFTMRDLRNGSMVKNVTQRSARRLWHYAISRYMELEGEFDPRTAYWNGEFGLLKRYQQGKTPTFDLVQRLPDDGYRFFFGVTPNGIHGGWKLLTEEDENSSEPS